MTTDCIFCKMAAGIILPDIVLQNEHILAFRDINPQAPQHILIIPREHIASLEDLEEEKHLLVAGELLLAARKVAEATGMSNQGYRSVINCGRDGGQEVYHLHMHLLGGRPMQWPPG